jgi:hypothetical protein
LTHSFPLAQVCPRCFDADVRELTHTNMIAWVWYFRCDTCGHVWNFPKPRLTQPSPQTEPARDFLLKPERHRASNLDDE